MFARFSVYCLSLEKRRSIIGWHLTSTPTILLICKIFRCVFKLRVLHSKLHFNEKHSIHKNRTDHGRERSNSTTRQFAFDYCFWSADGSCPSANIASQENVSVILRSEYIPACGYSSLVTILIVELCTRILSFGPFN